MDDEKEVETFDEIIDDLYKIVDKYASLSGLGGNDSELGRKYRLQSTIEKIIAHRIEKLGNGLKGEYEMKNKYNKEKAIEAITEYIYFIENNRDKNGNLSPENPEKFDSRRKQLHLAIAEVFGLSENSYPNYKTILDFTTLDGFIWDKWLGDGRKLEEYVEIMYWDIVDKLNKHHAPYTEIETSYRTKLRIDDILMWTREKVEKRMKPIDEVMDEYERNKAAWNNDHNGKNPDEPYIYDHSNRHDYNGYVSSIKSALNKIELFAKQPMEAYLKVAVDVYLDKPLASIDEILNRLDGIAFRAQQRYKEEPFYKYIETVGKG